MTKREFFTAVANLENASEEIKAFAEQEISALDARNEKRRNTPTKTQRENAELDEQVYQYFVTNEINEPTAASEIAESFDITPSKMSAVCGRLEKAGKLVSTQIKSTAKSGGKIKGYKLA